MFFFCAHITAFVLGIWAGGVVGLAVAYAISNTIVEPIYAWITTRELGIPFRRVWRNLVAPATATALMIAVVLPLRMLLVHAGAGPAVRLGIVAVAGLAVYLPLCFWRVPDVAAELRRLARDLRPGRRVPAAEPVAT
jgi:peptidoglycan biosynthesis protein MviN/MurJ (putative lipid II flippase)